MLNGRDVQSCGDVEEMYTWLRNEGNENRWLWKTAEGQKQLSNRYWRAPTKGHQHDPRGVSSFVNSDDFFLPTEWPGGEYDPDTILDKRLKQQHPIRNTALAVTATTPIDV